MAGHRVHMFELGYCAGIDLAATARLVNSGQQEIQIEVLAGRYPIGEPDVNARAYPKAALFQHFPRPVPGEVSVGVTVAPIEGNLSTLTQGVDSIAISLHGNQLVSAQAGRSLEEFLAQTLVTEWLWLQYRQATGDPDFRKLFHTGGRACAFHLVLDTSEKVHKLRHGHICERCAGTLDRAGVPRGLVSAVTTVLDGRHRAA
jgi:hypothetical protein